MLTYAILICFRSKLPSSQVIPAALSEHTHAYIPFLRQENATFPTFVCPLI